jgi:ABC-type branched-subunit amino acid transport system ATPase component
MTIVLIEHDMSLVFRFAQRITCSRADASSRRVRPPRSPLTRACASSTSETPMSDLLRLDGVTAGYGDAIVLEDVSLGIGAGGSVAILAGTAAGKTTLLLTIMGSPGCTPAASSSTAPTSARCRRTRARAGSAGCRRSAGCFRR